LGLVFVQIFFNCGGDEGGAAIYIGFFLLRGEVLVYLYDQVFSDADGEEVFSGHFYLVLCLTEVCFKGYDISLQNYHTLSLPQILNIYNFIRYI